MQRKKIPNLLTPTTHIYFVIVVPWHSTEVRNLGAVVSLSKWAWFSTLRNNSEQNFGDTMHGHLWPIHTTLWKVLSEEVLWPLLGERAVHIHLAVLRASHLLVSPAIAASSPLREQLSSTSSIEYKVCPVSKELWGS